MQYADHSRTYTVCSVITLKMHRKVLFGEAYFPRSFKVLNLQHELGCLSPFDGFVSINWHNKSKNKTTIIYMRNFTILTWGGEGPSIVYLTHNPLKRISALENPPWVCYPLQISYNPSSAVILPSLVYIWDLIANVITRSQALEPKVRFFTFLHNH